MAEKLGILLISGTHERAHYALVMATGAAALGRDVVLFATNGGCRALMADWSGLEGAEQDQMVRDRGVAGFSELRGLAGELGIRLIACEAGLRAADLAREALLAGVEVGGVASFLAATRGGQMLSL
jgi:peroxiredoxin family protein